jgi:heat shock protein HslJ
MPAVRTLAPMPSSVRRAWDAILTLSVVAACSGALPDSEFPVPSPMDLIDHVYFSTSVTNQGVTYPLLPDTSFRLSFSAVGGGGNAGCNGYAGRWSIQDGRLVFDEFSGTLMGCDQAHERQDQWMVSILSSRPAIGLKDGSLVLATGPWLVSFRDRGNPPAIGTGWLGRRLMVDGQEIPFPRRFVPVLTLEATTISLQVGECWIATAPAHIDPSSVRVDAGADMGSVLVEGAFDKAPLEGFCEWPELAEQLLGALSVGSFSYRVVLHDMTIDTGRATLNLEDG